MTEPRLCITSSGYVVVVDLPDDAKRVELDRKTFDELVELANRQSVTPRTSQ